MFATRGRAVLAVGLLLLAALAHAMPQDLELDNDVIPREPQAPLQPSPTSSEKPAVSSTSSIPEDSKPEASDVSPADKPSATEKPAARPKPQDSFFTRLIDDFIQIPIAALRAVNQLLNNINLRSRHAAAANSTVVHAPLKGGSSL